MVPVKQNKKVLLLPPSPLHSLAGLKIKLTQGRLTGERNKFN